jgi:hypothetical protein
MTVISHYEIPQLTKQYFAFIPWTFCNQFFKIKLLLKVTRRGFNSSAALYIADCALAPNVVPSFISRGATTPSVAGALY